MVLRRGRTLALSAMVLAGVLFGFAPTPVSAATDWSFESSATDSGWQIEVEEGSGHVEGDCTSIGDDWLLLEPMEGTCYVQFSQENPTAFALHHVLPNGKYIVFRHVDEMSPYLVAIDAVSLDGDTLQFTMASENLIGEILDVESETWDLGAEQQKIALYLLSEEPGDWFHIDPTIVEAVLLSPSEMEVDFDGDDGEGDTDGQWVTRTCNLETAICNTGVTEDPLITASGRFLLTGSTIEFASVRVRWAWLSCRISGDAGENRRVPSDCRTVSRGAGFGSSLERRPYRVTARDRARGFLRVAIYADGVWHYSSTHSVR